MKPYGSLFEGFTTEEIQEVIESSQATTRELPKGATLFSPGEKPESFYILLSGSVEVMRVDSEGRRRILSVFSEKGSLFAEVYAFLKKQSYDYLCITREPSSFLQFPTTFYFEETEDPLRTRLLLNMMKILAHKAFYLSQKSMILATASLRGRIARYLLSLTSDDVCTLPLNRNDLADYLGVSRPALSRELMSMQEEGLFCVQGRKVTRMDRKAMESIG
ncbi:MAG TPA: Crp/Fnr family transcriptional regulator [Tissierellia bacterium]|jgi:CRP-like cAMP-binding protein|nr:Crp/Fnr family transcriptional regulator [Tissierellia bacterium]